MSTNPDAGGGVVQLAAPGSRALVDLDHGARLASLEVGGRELLIGPEAAAAGAIRWGAFLMAPWPGRLANGRLRWAGRSYQLQRTHGRHAIHGLVHDRPWTTTEVTPSTVAAWIDLRDSGWPFAGRVRQRVSLEPGQVRFEAAIEADERMPAALGWHPWFDRRGADPRVTVAADRVLVLDRMLPTGETAAVAGRTDLRRGPRLGRRRLDDAYVEVRSPASVAWPDLELGIEFDHLLSTIVVHTPARAFCVEPQTAWPNAMGFLARGAETGAPIVLEAGGSLAATMRWRWGRGASA